MTRVYLSRVLSLRTTHTLPGTLSIMTWPLLQDLEIWSQHKQLRCSQPINNIHKECINFPRDMLVRTRSHRACHFNLMSWESVSPTPSQLGRPVVTGKEKLSEAIKPMRSHPHVLSSVWQRMESQLRVDTTQCTVHVCMETAQWNPLTAQCMWLDNHNKKEHTGILFCLSIPVNHKVQVSYLKERNTSAREREKKF